jgi:hypothetical protein
MRDFIRMCKTQGKTKMIFDMRGNGGGKSTWQRNPDLSDEADISYRQRNPWL